MKKRDLFARLIHARPLFLASFLFLCGCILQYALELSPWICCAGIALFLSTAAALWRSKKAFAVVMLLLCMLPAGGLRFALNWRALDPLPEATGAALCGRIVEQPVWNAEDERAICVLDDLTINGEAARGQIRLYLRGDAERLQAVALADRIECVAHVWRAKRATNFGQFDFSNFLRLNGLRGYATAEIESASITAEAYRFSDLRQRLRSRIASRIDRLFPQNAALARAFLLADRSMLSDAERENYRHAGVAHLLAVSGMHISAIAWLIHMLLGRWMKRRNAFALTLVLLFLYAFFAGFTASMTRALLMFALFGLAPLVGRYADSPTTLAAAMLVSLLIRPIAILDCGFILSYGAAAGIIFLNAPLQRALHIHEFVHNQTPGVWIALMTKRIPTVLLLSLIATLSAQLAVLPAVVHFFGAQPLWSILVNLLAVPLAMAGYIFSILAVLTGLPPVGTAADFCFALLSRAVQFFAAMPVTALRIARFPAWLSLLCALCVFLASDLSKIPESFRRLMPMLIVCAALLSNFCAQCAAYGCSIVFLDAGQADCAVIRTEGKVYLIDTGDGYSPAPDYLSAMNYAVDGVFLSHLHDDHAGGLRKILDVCVPKRIYISANHGAYQTDPAVAEALRLAESMGSTIVLLEKGDSIALSAGTNLRILAPEAGFAANSANDDSLVIRVDYGEASALFCGDAQAELVSACAEDVDCIKVAHHGAADALNPSLLKAASPSVAIVSVGYNTYGHPAPKTLELLAAADVQTLRTDLCGAITCKLHANGMISIRTHSNSENANES